MGIVIGSDNSGKGKLETSSGFLLGNIIRQRKDDDGYMFWIRQDGTMVAHLKDYAIIPIEEYDALLKKSKRWWKRK